MEIERENVQPGKVTRTAICTTCYSCPWHKKTATCTTGGAKPVAERGGGVDIHKRITAAVLGTGLISTADCPNGCEGCEHEAGEIASAVIAALGLREVHDGEGHYWQTPWERIEGDG